MMAENNDKLALDLFLKGENGNLKNEKRLKIIKDFIRFLLKNNVYNNFLVNFYKADKEWASKYHTSRVFVLNFIGCAFYWSLTKEGHDFWSDIEFKWDLYVSKKYKTSEMY